MIEVRVDTTTQAQPTLRLISATLRRFPGDHAVRVVTGDRAVTYGPAFRADGSPELMALLGEFGEAVLRPG